VGSMCGLVLMAWVTECPGVIYPLCSLKRVENHLFPSRTLTVTSNLQEEQEGTHLQQADYHHLMQERIMGASFSGDRRNGIDSLQA
jgi:hypothetical protein